VKVRINVSGRLFGDDPARVFAGEEIELPEHQARELISRGEASELLPEEPVVEVAEAEADAAADSPKPIAKRRQSAGNAEA